MQTGHCGATVDGEHGDCDLGDKGWIGLRPSQSRSWDSARRACVAACRDCDRCRFVSFSLQYKDCSWYHSCESLVTKPEGFRTVLVRNETGESVAVARKRRRHGRRRDGPLSSERRNALFHRAGSPAWVTPHESMRLALLFFGKIGTLRDPSSYTDKDSGDEAMVRLSYGTVRRHVIDANPLAKIDVFVHSWNPALGSLLEQLYRPVWSAHEDQVYDERVPSAALSLKRVLEAKARREASAGGYAYDIAAALRHDLVLFAPLRLAALPAAQLWLPMQCCGADPEGVAGAAWQRLRDAYDVTRRTCLTGEGTVSELCRVRNMLRSAAPRASRRVSDEANFNYWVNDWLLLAPSRTLDSFAAISDRIDDYRDGLREVGISIEWMHFFWAAHVHHGLRCADGVRALPLRAAVDFTIARLASAERMCATNVSVAASLPTYSEPRWGGGLPERLCPMRGAIACKWNSVRCSADTPRV